MSTPIKRLDEDELRQISLALSARLNDLTEMLYDNVHTFDRPAAETETLILHCRTAKTKIRLQQDALKQITERDRNVTTTPTQSSS